MRSLPVVVAQPGFESPGSLIRGPIGPGVRPFPQERLDESLRLAVGGRGVGLGAQVMQAELVAGPGEIVRTIAAAVVGHHALGTNALAPKPADRPSEERDARGRALVGRVST